MGDLRGEGGGSILFEEVVDGACAWWRTCTWLAPDPDEVVATSSSCSITTRPLDVISLFRVMRLWGNSPRDVFTCWRTA